MADDLFNSLSRQANPYVGGVKSGRALPGFTGGPKQRRLGRLPLATAPGKGRGPGGAPGNYSPNIDSMLRAMYPGLAELLKPFAAPSPVSGMSPRYIAPADNTYNDLINLLGR